VSSLSQASIGKAGATSPASCSFAPPPNYLLECSLEFNPQDQFTIHFRAQKTSEEAYRLILSPSINEASIEGKTFKYPRQVSFEPGKPIKIQAFVEDSLIECFINEGYAFSCRAYDLKEGGLTLQVSQGIAQIPNLSIKIQGK
jgi:sucrose-6-phosphate hydrolase SacC (GH32 family)